MKIEIKRIDYDDGGWGEFEEKDGVAHGWTRTYHSNGKPHWLRFHVNGREHGISRTWIPRGQLIEETGYQDGELHGHWKEWNSRGALTRNDRFAFGECISDRPRRRAYGYQSLLLEPFRRKVSSEAAKLSGLALKKLRLMAAVPVKRKRAGDRSRISSWLCDVTHGPRGKIWPTVGDIPMVPMLQLRVDQLPAVPPGLKGIAFLALFAPREYPIHDGQDELMIWTTKSLRELQPLDTPRGSRLDKPRSITWKLDAEYPNLSDLPAGLKAHLEDHEPRSPLLRRTARIRTRVGGWPGWIQSTELKGFGEIILQFDTVDTWKWMPSGNPNFYLYKSRKTKRFHTISECF